MCQFSNVVFFRLNKKKILTAGHSLCLFKIGMDLSASCVFVPQNFWIGFVSVTLTSIQFPLVSS